jgi:hypothetical protein
MLALKRDRRLSLRFGRSHAGLVLPVWVELAISRSDPDWSIYGMKQTSVNAGQATQFGQFCHTLKAPI